MRAEKDTIARYINKTIFNIDVNLKYVQNERKRVDKVTNYNF